MIQRFNAWVDRQHVTVQAVVWLTVIFVIRTFVFGLYVVPSPSMETTMLIGERFLADKATPWVTGIHHEDIISFNAPDYPYSDNAIANWYQRYIGVYPRIGSPIIEWGPSNWTKRVIGGPGDHMKGTIENGVPVVYRNGNKLDEPYVNTYPLVTLWSYDGQGFHGVQPIDHRSYDPNKGWRDQPFYSINPAKIVKLPNVQTFLRPQQPAPNVSDEFDVKLGPDEYWVMGDNRLASRDSRAWGPLPGRLIHGKIRFCLFSIDSDYSWWFMHLFMRPFDFFTKVRWSRTFRIVT